jgi:hypothetical protein
MHALARLAGAGALALGAALAVAQSAPTASDAPFERAMHDYEAQRFGKAFDALALLADGGHPEAARIALLMSAQGLRLYGRRFELHPLRRERWLDSATGPDRRLAVGR